MLLGAAAAAEPPEACRAVPAGADLAAAVEAAPAGAVLCLADGVHAGPVTVHRPLVLRGSRDAVIRAAAEGTTVRLEAPGAALLGMTVDGSGGRFDLLDAAVRVEGDGVRVEGVAIRDALFGILVEKSRDVRVRGNVIEGQPDKVLGLRGDAIRLWEVRGSRIEGNHVRHARDVVVWYSPGNEIVENVVEHGRYGTHFMYSHDNIVRGNRYVANVVGVFVMYSRDLAIEDNLFAKSAGAAGVGLGTKESGNVDVTGNRFVANTVGAYLDTSPLQKDHWNHFAGNVFAFGDAGVVFHSSPERNTFRGNDFRDNETPVRVEGRGDAMGVVWERNHFDDYAGYDLDGDGIGDVPYELRSLSQVLVSRHPALAFFRGSPALGLVEWIGRAVPLFQVETILVDPEPLIAAPRRSLARAD